MVIRLCLSVLTHFRFFCSGWRRSTWPASVSDFLAVDQDLHARDGRQVDRQRVDDRVDGEELVERAAGVLASATSPLEIDERVASLADDSARSAVPAGIAEASGAGAAPSCASTMRRACSTTGSPNGTSRWTPTSDKPSSAM